MVLYLPCRYITELLGGEMYVSCYVVLSALCHFQRTMKVSDIDRAYIARLKAAFTKDLNVRKENSNLWWLKVATCLDPRFKRGCHKQVHMVSWPILQKGTWLHLPQQCHVRDCSLWQATFCRRRGQLYHLKI